MKYSILWHQGTKPHFIIAKSLKEIIKKDLEQREYRFLQESTVDIKPNKHILFRFNNLSIEDRKYVVINNSPFSYLLCEFNELRKAINQCISKGNRGGYSKLMTKRYAFCIEHYMLFAIRDFVLREERNKGIVLPYEETNEDTELR